MKTEFHELQEDKMTTSTHFIRSLFLFAILVSFISGCAETGPSYTSVKSTIPQLQSDNARIYFLREASSVNYGLTARVHLNGIKVVDLNMDGFAYVNRPAGNVLIMVAATCSIRPFALADAYWDLLTDLLFTEGPRRKDAPLNFGEARKMFTVESGKTYYFLVANDSSNVMAGLIGGAFISERIFGIPGIGSFAIDSIFQRDYPVLMAITLIGSAAFVVANLLADVAYAFVDPRIRYS